MLYSNFKGNINKVREIAQEENTILEYKNQKSNVEVGKIGLVICKSHPYLAASPDGIVKTENSEGLIEIKNFLQNNKYSIREAITKVPNFCLEISKDKIQLKRKHEIYIQIQGQLNITEKNWCDFVLRRINPYDIYIERIYRDKKLWADIMPKLTAFYHKFFLPELACPRHGTYSGIRKPESPWYVAPLASSVSSKASRSHPIVSTRGKKASCSSAIISMQSHKEEHGICRSERQKKFSAKSVEIAGTTGESVDTARTTSKSVCKSVNTARSSYKSVDTTRDNSKSVDTATTSQGLKFKRKQTFVGKRIQHEWVVNEDTGEKQWYNGTVLRIVKGKDGSPKAVYDVKYDNEENATEVDNLIADLKDGSLKFLDDN